MEPRDIIDIVSMCCIGFAIIYFIVNTCRETDLPIRLAQGTINQTAQPQQDIETGQVGNVLMFKDIEKELEEEEGCGKCCCPICLEEYEDDHEMKRLNKCGHYFHHLCLDSWLTQKRTCPSCRGSVDY